MNILYVISSQSAYGIAFRVIVASSFSEALNMKNVQYPKSLYELGWNDDCKITYQSPTTDSIGIKAEVNS